jgi:tetratricopeptide (TPR) repeat protein
VYDQAVKVYGAVLTEQASAPDCLKALTGMAQASVQLGEDIHVGEITDRFLSEHAGEENLLQSILQIGEEYYYLGQMKSAKGDAAAALAAYQKSIDLLESTLSAVQNQRDRCVYLYTIGINYWQLKQWFAAAEAFLEAIETDPNFRFAGSMHRLIADCYEHLKEEGLIDKEEADSIIEWGYQAVFERYSQPPYPAFEAEYAAMRLGEMNLARGRPVTACVYLNWILDRAEDNMGLAADGRSIGHFVLCIPQEDGSVLILDGPNEPKRIDAANQSQWEKELWDGTILLIQTQRQDYLEKIVSERISWQTAVEAAYAWFVNDGQSPMDFTRITAYSAELTEQQMQAIRGGCIGYPVCVPNGQRCYLVPSCNTHAQCELGNIHCVDTTIGRRCMRGFTGPQAKDCQMPNHSCTPEFPLKGECVGGYCVVIETLGRDCGFSVPQCR